MSLSLFIPPLFGIIGLIVAYKIFGLVMQYKTGKGWHDARIQPYQPFSLDPAAMVLHYAQEIFEGLKAYGKNRHPFQKYNHTYAQ